MKIGSTPVLPLSVDNYLEFHVAELFTKSVISTK